MTTRPDVRAQEVSTREEALSAADSLDTYHAANTSTTHLSPEDNNTIDPNQTGRRGSARNSIVNFVTRRSSASPSRSQDSSSSSLSPSQQLQQQHQQLQQQSRASRKPSPGLLARIRALDNKSRIVSSPAHCQDKIGKIPESQIRELEAQNRAANQPLVVERRGRAWSGSNFNGQQYQQPPRPTTGGSSVSMEPPRLPDIESDHSSIISISDRFVPSDSEHEQSDVAASFREDNHKFRIPEFDSSPPRSHSYLSATESMQNEEPTLEDPTPPPSPPPKDTPTGSIAPSITTPTTAAEEAASDFENYLRNGGPSRGGSIYSLSRVSFTNQIQQLTSINLPDATSLSSSISAIPTSHGAGKALLEAANQIKQWMRKASEVLNGLDADDDVEWAAAAGREGLDEVDAAVNRFETLITVYVTAIDELQGRSDFNNLAQKDLMKIVDQMESILGKWDKIKRTLNRVKGQVEMAMEWEELWNSVLGEIGLELEALGRLVFEMEERRHRSTILSGLSDNVEIGELETIVEEAPKQNLKASAANRFSFTPAFGTNSPLLSPTSEAKQEESSLLALFARMQPLRASLDFLPMRLSNFQMRATAFPSANEDLDKRCEQLEAQWQKLNGDAEALRRELGEDRWVHLFRNAAGKALSMWSSVMRSIKKLQQAFEENQDPETISNKLRTYEEKKPHYPPAIERVLAIIDKGVKDRLTVNGEILRLQADIRRKLMDLNMEIKNTDAFLEDMQFSQRGQQLRDSISTIMTEQSMSSSTLDTPGSSPASSVVMTRRSSPHSSMAKSRQSSFNSRGAAPTPSSNRLSYLSTPKHPAPSKTPVSRSSAGDRGDRRLSASPSRASSSTPLGRRQEKPADKRPKWNGSVNMNDTPVGHNFKPLTLTTPSQHRKMPTTPRTHSDYGLRTVSSQSSMPMPSPLSRGYMSPTPTNPYGRSASVTPGQRPQMTTSKSSRRISAIPAPVTSQPSTPLPYRPASALRANRPPPAHANRRVSTAMDNYFSLQRPPSGMRSRRGSAATDVSVPPTSIPRPSSKLSDRRASGLITPSQIPRPPSGLNSRRSSMMPESSAVSAASDDATSLGSESPTIRSKTVASRRTSGIPMPKTRTPSSGMIPRVSTPTSSGRLSAMTGRSSALGGRTPSRTGASSRAGADSRADDKPRFRL